MINTSHELHIKRSSERIFERCNISEAGYILTIDLVVGADVEKFDGVIIDPSVDDTDVTSD